MEELEAIMERIRDRFEAKNAARERALQHARTLTRQSALAIRAVHRGERPAARKRLGAARQIVQAMHADLADYPDLFHSGYTQDALKEYAEACIVYALLGGEPVPDPEALGVEYGAYLGGLSEATGELRRRVLDILRHDDLEEAERLLAAMDEIYDHLVTFDFPDAVTGGLRRLTDMVRGVTERTRGDLTTSVQQRRLQAALQSVEQKLDAS